MIDASENVTHTAGGKIYQFGNCKMKVDFNNIITRIYREEDDVAPTKSERNKLLIMYKRSGLNKAGTLFLKGDTY